LPIHPQVSAPQQVREVCCNLVWGSTHKAVQKIWFGWYHCGICGTDSPRILQIKKLWQKYRFYH